MNNPNPFLPKGSLLEQQSLRRSRLKLAVGCVLTVSVTGLVVMLIQGCERKKPDLELNPPPAVDTNTIPVDTNTLPNSVSNPPVTIPAAPTNPTQVPPTVPPPTTQANPVPPVPPVAPETSGAEYTVVKGDSLAKIAKKYGISAKALQAANPDVVPTKLKIGKKLVIPAGGKTSVTDAGTAAPAVAAPESGTTTYTVKSGDTLMKIAKAHGTTAKAIQAANNLTTTKIAVGKKLKIPSKAQPAPATPATAPVPDTTPVPTVPPPVSTPAPAPTK